jgi:predicted RNA-binding Zn ribbon-like protein
MSAKATQPNPEWKDGFLFVGNQLALDFLNTRPLQNGESVELIADFHALVRWFQAAELITSRQTANLRERWGESDRARRTAEGARELREKLRREVLAWERGVAVHRATIEELNRLMADRPMRTRLRAARNGLSSELWFDPRQPEDLFAPLAYSAAILFTVASRDRVRKCGQCVLHFLDTSKKGTRRWCSMRLCGNRLKVAAYAARRVDQAARTPSIYTD